MVPRSGVIPSSTPTPAWPGWGCSAVIMKANINIDFLSFTGRWPGCRRHQVDALESAQDFQSGISRSQLSHKSPQVNKGIIPGFPWGARSVRRSTSRCIHSKQPPAGERGSPTSTWTRPISTTGWAKPCLYALWMESSPSAWSPFR